jgi:hypothetical protein
MSRGPSPFRKADITRAIRAITSTGASVGRIEIKPDGTLNVFLAGQAANLPDDERALADFRAAHGYQ